MPTPEIREPQIAAAPSGRPSRRRRRRLLGVFAGALTAAVAAASIVGFSTSRSEAVVPVTANAEGGLQATSSAGASTSAMHNVTAVPLAQLDLYTDYTDPGAAQFAAVNGLAIQSYVKEGKIAIALHPIALGDSAEAREDGLRAGNAVACVGNFAPHDLLAFHLGLLAMQPRDGDAGLRTADLIALARDSGVHHLDDVQACIKDGRFAPWIEAESTRLPDEWHARAEAGEPLALVGGQPYGGPIDSEAAFREFLDDVLEEQ